MTLAELPQVAALSANEKFLLMGEMWISMMKEWKNAPVSEEEKRMLDGRWDDYIKSPEMTLTANEFKALCNAEFGEPRRS